MKNKLVTTKKMQKRGRPRGFDVDSAIATALELFHRRGYDGVGIAELSKSIGITAPSLYAAFGNKRSLFEQVLKRYAQTSGGWLPAVLAQEGELEEIIADFFWRAAEVYTADADCCGCLIMDATRNCSDEAAKALTDGFKLATRQLICDRLKAGSSDLSASAVEALANYICMVLVGLSGSARDGMDAAQLKAAAEIASKGFNQQLQQYRIQQHQGNDR
ncbi:MAG: TetR/AcrR family transcriptional regulator [Cyanobacteria bacterium J06631_12]